LSGKFTPLGVTVAEISVTGQRKNSNVINSVSETIRKPPLVKAQTALRKQKQKNKIWRKNDFKYGGWNSYTLQCGTIMTLISPGDCTLQCGMWLWGHDS